MKKNKTSVKKVRSAYVCAVFFGPRRSWESHWGDVDPLYCLRMQIAAISEHSTAIDKIIFVCNLREDGVDDAVYEQAAEIVTAKHISDHRDWFIFSRPNVAFSYGAWEEALCNHTEGMDYAFLIEDDYVPCKTGFDEELLTRYFSDERSRDRVIYCSSWWAYDMSANSNGIINLHVFRQRNTFSLPARNARKPHYKHGDACQRLFLRKFTQKNYKIIDMSQHYSFPFFCMRELQDVHRGLEDGDVLIRPVSYEGATLS